MQIDEARRLAIRIPTLRKKEVTSKLSISERQELESMLVIQRAAYPDNSEQQYAERVRWTAIRNFTIKDVTPKVSLIQKILSKENEKEYRIEFEDEEKDVATYEMSFANALLVRQVMEVVGLEVDWPAMMPVDDGMFYTDPLDEDDKKWFEALPDSKWCALKLQEAKNLEEKAADHGDKMVQAIDWLKMHWESKYKIYADIDPQD